MVVRLETPYHARSSPVHSLDPRTKLLSALSIILTLSLLPFGAWLIYLVVWCAVLAISYVARLSLGALLRRSFVALPFALAALALPFTVPGTAIATLPVTGWSVTTEGLVRAGSIVSKSWISVQAAILLVMTTTLPDLMWALRALRVPPVLVSIVSFMYRYLFVLADEAARLLRARASRSASLAGVRAGRDLWWRGRVAGYMVGSLMLRSFERSERIYHAMAARGYAGEVHMLVKHHLRAQDGWVLACVGIVAAALLAVARG